MTVPFLDLARLHASVRPDLDEAFDRVLGASSFVGGSEVTAFEQLFAELHGHRSAAGCGSGTDALSLALRALGIGPGDDVIVPAMTFVATAEAVVHVGATPVLADVDPITLLLNDAAVARARTSSTRAVLPVHLYGHVVPFDDLQRWREDDLIVVEDAAQAHLGEWRGRLVGSIGHAACFSFYPGKNLGALGDGGLVLSGDDGVVAAVRRLRDHGRASKYEHDQIGWCSRLDGLQAAFLLAKGRSLGDWTASRRRIADRYRALLGDLLVPWEDGAVHHLLVARVPADRRSEIQRSMAAAGIATGIHYPIALSRMKSLAPWATPCPNAEAAAAEVLSLPMDPLMSDDDVDRSAAALLDALASSG